MRGIDTVPLMSEEGEAETEGSLAAEESGVNAAREEKILVSGAFRDEVGCMLKVSSAVL